MRPDYVPRQRRGVPVRARPPPPADGRTAGRRSASWLRPPRTEPQPTDPANGLQGLMVSHRSGIMTGIMTRRHVDVTRRRAGSGRHRTVAGCSAWQGPNSLPLPGTAGHGAGSYTIQAQMPDVDNIDRNSRVRVGDVTVGTVTEDRTPGLACAGHDDHRRRGRPARQRHREDGSDQPIGLQAHRIGAPDDGTARGQAARRLADPAVLRRRVPDHRADAGGAVAGPQRRRHRPDPRDHAGLVVRVRRPRRRPAQPASPSWTSSSATSTIRATTSSPPPTA